MKKNKKEEKLHHTEPDSSLLNELPDVDEEIWEHLKFDFDLVEEPPELKDEVMNFVFQEESPDKSKWEKVIAFFQTVRSQFTPLTTGLSLALLAGIVLLLIPWLQTPADEGFSELSASLKLTGVNGEQDDAYGHAFLLNKHGKEELVVNVFGFPQTEGQEVYQVWLIENGKRHSAGIFKPDKDGTGVLTVDLVNSFEKIGITLEPDGNSKQPRGTKIAGS